MNLSTLTLYSISSGLCFALSLVLLVFSQVRQGTHLVRMTAWSLITLAIGFLFAGFGPAMPMWVTVIDTNVALLVPGVLLYSGIRAFTKEQPARVDWQGVAMIAAAVPFFYYWGLVEPDGMRRATVFSITDTLINVRTCLLLVEYLRQKRFRWSLFIVTTVFAVFSVWMAMRAVHLMLADPLPAEMKAGNPTTWQTVFAMNVLIAIFVVCVLAMEIGELFQRGIVQDPLSHRMVAPLRDHIALLWGIVLVVLIAVVSELGIAYLVIYKQEAQRLEEQNIQANTALTEHAHQLIHQADLALRATRNLVQKRYPTGDLETFVAGLGLQQPIFENIFILNADGELILPFKRHVPGARAFHQAYFRFHRENAADVLYIGPVATGKITGKPQFRLSRRINDAQGHFAGVVFIPMEPMVFTQRYSEVMSGQDKVAALIGTDDRLTRAALTMTDLARMNTPLRSPLWSELSRTDVGDFENTSPVDGVHRRFHFRHLAGLPLIMVTGFSEADVQRNTLQNIKPFAMATALTLVVALTMAYLLAVALKRRDEQERFLSMISHELRTPMSVISVLSGTSAMSEDVGRRIGRAVASMDAIIDSALQSDRLRYGKVSVSLQDCAPRPLLQDMLGSATEPERLHLETPALPLLRTDPQLLRTIVSNLISNALKYSAPGTAVEILARPITHRRRQGIGITVSNQVGAAGSPDARQIFRKYYRAPGAHGKSGSGLGLHIAEGLARLLGGHLRHSSEKDQVQFTLWIPL